MGDKKKEEKYSLDAMIVDYKGKPLGKDPTGLEHTPRNSFLQLLTMNREKDPKVAVAGFMLGQRLADTEKVKSIKDLIPSERKHLREMVEQADTVILLKGFLLSILEK